MQAEIDHIRRFNRTVTQRVGALNDRFLARDRPLASSRLLWEIGAEGAEVVMLRARLGVDSGQMSRMLRGLEADGLVTVTPSDADGRVRVARLTGPGLAERAVLDARSDELAASILGPLDPTQRTELVSAMRTVARLLAASLVELREVDPEEPRRAALPACVRRRAQSPGARARLRSAQGRDRRAPRGAASARRVRRRLPARGGDRLRGGEAPAWRRDRHQAHVAGRVGPRPRARPAPARAPRAARPRARVHAGPLETSDVLPEAIALYRSAGYVEVAAFNDEPFADRWFTKPLARSAA